MKSLNRLCLTTSLRKLTLTLGLILISTGSGFAETQKVYKWVDENGKVHYSDRPISEDAETLEVKNDVSPEARRKAQQQAQRLIQLQQRRISAELENRIDAEREQLEQENQAKELNQACNDARQAIKVLEFQAPVFETTETGERRYIEDDERAKELTRLREAIKEHCS